MMVFSHALLNDHALESDPSNFPVLLGDSTAVKSSRVLVDQVMGGTK